MLTGFLVKLLFCPNTLYIVKSGSRNVDDAILFSVIFVIHYLRAVI